MNKTIKSIAVATLMLLSLIIIIVDIVPKVKGPVILVVDDDGGKDYETIQEAVDAAQPGDTVFVLNGTYHEDVYINKTINLTGISRDNTTINATSLGIFVENADYVNISGFTILNGSSAGIRLMPSNNSLVGNNRVEWNTKGIQIIESNNTIVRNNIASNNTNDYGIYLDRSTNITVKNNTCYGNQGKGIYIFDNSHHNLISGNNISGNAYGIYSTGLSCDNYIYNNTLISNSNYGIGDFSPGGNNTYESNTILNGGTGFAIATGTDDVRILNSSIRNMSEFDIRIGATNTYLTIINTSFNKSKVRFITTSSIINVQWYLHVNVIDYLDNPVPIAKVKVEDNKNGSYNETFTTDGNGYKRWLKVTEYIEQDTNGDEVGEKTYYTPHRIIAWNDTLVGYADPEPVINESKTVTIILYNGTLLNLENNWNLISLPRIQSDTNLQAVLQSIEKDYDSVWQYNITDSYDQWKHYHVSKPSYMNDLVKLNHTMGFWLHITDPEGTTLIVFGEELTTEQYIVLRPGWNLVGYPSKSDKKRDIALDNIIFPDEVDKVMRYNTTSRQMEEVTNDDYLEVGQGYWMHSKVDKTWNVPL